MRMSENVGHVVENAITERRRRFQKQKRVYRVKTLINERRRFHIAKTWPKMTPRKAVIAFSLGKDVLSFPSENAITE